jgi:CSLREA domain-containing protein
MLAAASCAWLSACTIGPIDHTGKSCPDGRCPEGYTCSPAQTCIATAQCPAGQDGGCPPPTVTYPVDELYAVLGASSVSLAPTVTGSGVSFQVSPPLPAGLSLNGATGVISGTPTSAAEGADYLITASNPGGAATFSIKLTALSGYIVDSAQDQPDDNGGSDEKCFSTAAGGCTLRAAIQTANHRPDRRLVLLGAARYAVDSSLGGIVNSVYLVGQGAAQTIIQPSSIHPGYGFITGTSNASIALKRILFTGFGSVDGAVVHLSGGTLDVDSCDFSNNTGTKGAVFCIDNGSSATIKGSSFERNVSDFWGGVIHAQDNGTAVVVAQCTATENTADWGAFSHLSSGAKLTLENSTLYGNVSNSNGVLASPGGAYKLVNDTIAYNTNTQSGGSAGIYLYSTPASYQVANTILAFNRNPDGELNCFKRDVATTVESLGGNIVTDGASNCGASFTGNRDRLSTDPFLADGGPKASGGVTKTILLRSGSPAIDGGVSAMCPAIDQRGHPRPGASMASTAVCDVGAVEMQ